MDKDLQIQHLKLQLKAEKAQSSWLDELANEMRDYANRSNMSNSEREHEQEKHELVEELYNDYKKVDRELKEFEKQHNL